MFPFSAIRQTRFNLQQYISLDLVKRWELRFLGLWMYLAGRRSLLGSLLLLLLLLGITLVFLLLGNKESKDLLGLDHVVLIDVELTEDVVDLGLGHLVSPGLESVLEHLDVHLSLNIVSLEGLDDEVV